MRKLQGLGGKLAYGEEGGQESERELRPAGGEMCLVPRAAQDGAMKMKTGGDVSLTDVTQLKTQWETAR